MPIIRNKFAGHWVQTEYESPKSHHLYVIDSHWEVNENRWMPITCNCKSFAHRMTCRHLMEIYKELSDVPAPEPISGNLPLKIDFWCRCPVCNGVEFMIRPFEPKTISNADSIITTDIICSQCGRLYKL